VFGILRNFSRKPHAPLGFALHQDGDAVRWQPYPEANGADKALVLANARAGKECRSFSAKMAAINRQHGVRKAKVAVTAAHEAERAIRSAIAKAPAAGALAIASEVRERRGSS
jgi:hypothetical protein